MGRLKSLFCALFVFLLLEIVDGDDILCDSGFCRTYGFETGCTPPSPHCKINNATHSGMWLPSPTICNCCEYCLPFYGKDEYCSTGGPGTGTTVGRCGDGLTCTTGTKNDHSTCQRMESKCHSAQDDYDRRHALGQTGALEFRPHCNGKGDYGVFDCVPTQTCFCQNKDGERIFGEVLNMGAVTTQNMQCGCSLLHEKITKDIQPGVPYPVIGPRCTADGNFNPVQCVNKSCYCVDKITGKMKGSQTVSLQEKPITELDCYDPAYDFYPSQSTGDPPYNFTTPCIEGLHSKIEMMESSVEEGFILDYFSSVSGCLPDGTVGRIAVRNGTKICVDEQNLPIKDYAASPNREDYEEMDCKCAVTSKIMASSAEKPVCCKNGNFRRIQCRRGVCRCVDSDGRQVGVENTDVTKLACYTSDWRDC